MSSSTDSPKVLLSYAPEDAEWAEGWLLSHLEKQGVNVFVINRDLLAGGTRLEQLAEQALRAQHTLIVLSPSWVASQSEAFIGLVSHSSDPLGRQRKTIPLVRKACEPPRSLARLVQANFTSREPSEWKREFDRLLAVLQGQQHRTALGPPLGALLGLEAPTNFIYPKNRHFVGRDQELAEIHELLDDADPLGVSAARPDFHGASRLLGLTGLGGVGKTQLVVEYIYRYREAYPGGIFWINAADGLEPGFAAIGRVINPDTQGKSNAELIQTAADYLRGDSDTLLILDNLNDPALLNQPVMGIVAPLSLPCRVLFTTRRRDLRGLRAISVDVLTEVDALKLLLRGRPEMLEVTHVEHALAIKVCATLGGLPLAIELAASYLEQESDVTLTGYLNRLGKYGALNTVDSLEQAKDWSPTWHDPVQITLHSQWEAVTDSAARLLLQAAALMPEAEAIPIARLSLLTSLSNTAEDGFPAPLLSAVRHLNNYSLLEQLETGKRARLHPLVREFVRAQSADLQGFAFACSANMGTALNDMLRVNSEILERGVDELLADVEAAFSLSPNNSALQELMLVLDREAHNLRRSFAQTFPTYILQQIRTRALNLQKISIVARAESALNMIDAPWFRERFPTTMESPGLLRTFVGHKTMVTGVAIATDGQHAISSAGDRTLRMWDIESGQCLRIYEGHPELVACVTLTADGRRVVTAANNILYVWDLESGQCLRRMRGHKNSITGIVMTSDSRYAISASVDDTLRVWDVQSGRCLRILEGHLSSNSTNDMTMTPDDRYVLAASLNYTVGIWDIESGRKLQAFQGHSNFVTSIAITPNGKSVVSASRDNTLRLWDLESGRCLQILQGHTSEVTSVAITPDGKRAISGSMDKTLRLWDLESGENLCVFKGHTNWIIDVAITPSGDYALSASGDDTLRLWDIQNISNLSPTNRHENMVTSVSITSDSKHVLSTSYDSTLRFWDVQNGEIVRILEGHKEPTAEAVISLDGHHALSASWDKTLRWWDLESGRCLKIFEGHTFGINSVDLTLDEKYALSASVDRTLRWWDLESGKNIHSAEDPGGNISKVVVTPDGKYAVSTADDYLLKLWEIESKENVSRFEQGHTHVIFDLAVTPDGSRVVSASVDESVRVWDMTTGRCIHTFKEHRDLVNGIAITSDSKYAISVSSDNTLRFWDVRTGQVLGIFVGEKFECVAVDQTDRLIVAGDYGGSVHFIDFIGSAENK